MFIIHPPHFLPPRGQRARALAVALLILAPLMYGALAVALGQDANWDLRNYHFYNAYAFLNDRYGRDILPAQIPTFYNPLLDVPFFLAATHWPARLVGFLLGCVQGLNFVLLFFIAHATLIVPNPRHKVVVCAALAGLGVLGGEGIALVGTTFGDNIVSIGFLLSAALVARHIESLAIGPARRAFILALFFGVPAGLMMGLKLPGVIYCAGLCGGFLFASGTAMRRVMLCFAFGLGIIAGVAVTYGDWGWFLYSHYGNPVFPYFNNVFHSPLEGAGNVEDTQYVPHGWRDILTLPFVFAHNPWRVGEIAWRDWRLPILYVVLPVAVFLRLFFGRNRAASDRIAAPYAARYLIAAFALSYAAWVALFAIYRYAVTMEMIAPLLIVLAVGMLPLKVTTRGLVAAFILAAVTASIQPGDWHRRATWTAHYVEAKIPALGDTSDLMILMASDEPYSHLVPEFPANISFIRVQSNFASPEQGFGIDKVMQARIDAHFKTGGRFMALLPPWRMDQGAAALRAFGLTLETQNCQTVTDILYDNTAMKLCAVKYNESKIP
ncbi:MAG: hypothetical protein KGI37_00475 [Alphaproteobacteria bacterium]|nr:hypothetical protein [Alphaproteobacteria bacterium]